MSTASDDLITASARVAIFQGTGLRAQVAALEGAVSGKTAGALSAILANAQVVPELVAAAVTSCESWGDPNKQPREFTETGAVLHGYPNPDDIGLGQINLPTWGATAKQLGFDLYTYEGNLAMSKWIFDHYGAAPWKYSKGCWQG